MEREGNGKHNKILTNSRERMRDWETDIQSGMGEDRNWKIGHNPRVIERQR